MSALVLDLLLGFRLTGKPQQHVFGLWEQTHKDRINKENMQTPQRKAQLMDG